MSPSTALGGPHSTAVLPQHVVIKHPSTSRWQCAARFSHRQHLRCARHTRGRKHCIAALSQRSLVYLSAADDTPQEAADSLRLQLQQLEEERKAATAKAESVASKGKRLAEAVTNLQNGALQAMKAGDEVAARELLQEKAVVSTALDKAKGRAAVNFSLAEKLNKLIGAKQTELIALLHRTGQQYGLPAKPFSVGPTGSISVDDDNTETAQSDDRRSTEEASTSGREAPQQPSADAGRYRSLAQDSQDYQAEDNIDNKFLELERQTLESMMQASSMTSDKASGPASHSSADEEQLRAASGEQASTTGTNAEGTGWWQSATEKLNSLKGDIGSLEAHQAREMAKDVTTILTRIINARVMRGQDPKAAQLIELAQLQVGVQASADPSVRIANPKTDFSSNIRQRLFRDAVAAAIAACSASSPGGQLPSWQELAAKWTSQLPTAATNFSPARNAVLAQLFLRSMAQLLKIEFSDANRIVHAAVAAHTRARLLDSLAIIKQAEGTSKKDIARGQMQQLAAVVDAFPLPEHSPEMELVYSGLKGFLVYEDRLLLYKAYRKATDQESSRHAMADALGMMY